MEFKGKAKPIDDIDLPRIGAQIGVGEDVIHMLLDVEADGEWFDSHGRPTMLFEPHIFFRELTGKQRSDAIKQGLAWATWQRNYPKDSYPRLSRAMRINKTAALRSCSWGGMQVMGFNHKLAGFSNVMNMVKSMMADAESHLQAGVNFIVSDGIDDELQELERISSMRGVTPDECIPFVSKYNGKGFRKNNYHVNAANALNKWRKIKDTPFNSSVLYPIPPQDTPEPTLPVDLPDDMQDGIEPPTGLAALIIAILKMLGMRK